MTGARFADEGAVAHLGERGPQVLDMGCLVGADVGHQRGRLAVAGDQVAVGKELLCPGEDVERLDLHEQHSQHRGDQHLEPEVEIVEHPPVEEPLLGDRRVGAGSRGDAHALEHRLGLVLGDRVLEGDVADGIPHAVVAGFLAPAGLISGVGLDEARPEVGGRRPRDVLVEVPLHVGRGEEADHGAEALDGADAGQRGDDRLTDPVAQQEACLVDVRVVVGPRLDRRVKDLGAERAPVLFLPCGERGRAEPGAGRDVGAVVQKTAVAADAAGDERLLEVVGREQLLGGEFEGCRHVSSRVRASRHGGAGRCAGDSVERCPDCIRVATFEAMGGDALSTPGVGRRCHRADWPLPRTTSRGRHRRRRSPPG